MWKKGTKLILGHPCYKSHAIFMELIRFILASLDFQSGTHLGWPNGEQIGREEIKVPILASWFLVVDMNFLPVIMQSLEYRCSDPLKLFTEKQTN